VIKVNSKNWKQRKSKFVRIDYKSYQNTFSIGILKRWPSHDGRAAEVGWFVRIGLDEGEAATRRVMHVAERPVGSDAALDKFLN
jgi:hypothetical protein